MQINAKDLNSMIEDKFLYFFNPVILDEKKFLFGFPLKTGVTYS